MPTQQPSQLPTTASIGSSITNSGGSGTQTTSTATISAVVACIIVFLIIIGVCVFLINKRQKEKTPFEIWTTHYSNKAANRPTSIQQPIGNEDIHHFYTKSPRLSISPNTAFTPHVSGRIQQHRNSKIGHQTNLPERERSSIQFRNAQTKYEL